MLKYYQRSENYTTMHIIIMCTHLLFAKCDDAEVLLAGEVKTKTKAPFI